MMRAAVFVVACAHEVYRNERARGHFFTPRARRSEGTTADVPLRPNVKAPSTWCNPQYATVRHTPTNSVRLSFHSLTDSDVELILAASATLTGTSMSTSAPSRLKYGWSWMRVYAACDYYDGAKRAGEYAGTDGIICAFGSLYSIHQAKEAFRAAGLIE